MADGTFQMSTKSVMTDIWIQRNPKLREKEEGPEVTLLLQKKPHGKKRSLC